MSDGCGTPEERVARGARFLDEKWPGWKGYVDPEKLDLTSMYDCVLGQLAPNLPELAREESVYDFGDVLRFLGKDSYWAEEYGFAAACGDDGSEECACRAGSLALKEEWLKVFAEAARS